MVKTCGIREKVKKFHNINLFVAASACFFCSNAILAKPLIVPVPLQSLQLNRPFTLKFSAAAQQDFHGSGKISNNNLLLTLSYDGKNLLFRSEDITTKTHSTHTVLYDGHETYEMDSDSRIAEIERGFDFSRMQFCPLPGVGIPHMPLFVQGFLSQPSKIVAPSQASEPKYIDYTLYKTSGQIRDYGIFGFSDQEAHLRSVQSGIASAVSVPISGVRKILWYDTFDNVAASPGFVWEFFKSEKFQDQWLATKIRMRWYATLTKTGKNVLLQEAAYNLVSAVNQPLEPRAYDPTTYLLDHTNIGDMTGSTIRSFVYYADKGSLQSQRQNESEVSKALAVTTKSKTNSGLIGLITIIIMSIFWFWWRRKRDAR